MKTILIPSDFSIESLKDLKFYLDQNANDDQLNIILLNAIYHDNDIVDLLFYNKQKQIKQLTNDAFLDAVAIIKNKFSNNIQSISFDIFSGYMQSSFNDFLIRNKVDLIVFPQRSKLKSKTKNSFDLKPFIKNSKIEKFNIQLEEEEYAPERNQVASIFNVLIPVRH